MSVKQRTITRKIRNADGTITDYAEEFGQVDIENIIDHSNADLQKIFKSKMSSLILTILCI
jgi:hypothetical protein